MTVNAGRSYKIERLESEFNRVFHIPNTKQMVKELSDLVERNFNTISPHAQYLMSFNKRHIPEEYPAMVYGMIVNAWKRLLEEGVLL